MELPGSEGYRWIIGGRVGKELLREWVPKTIHAIGPHQSRTIVTR